MYVCFAPMLHRITRQCLHWGRCWKSPVSGVRMQQSIRVQAKLAHSVNGPTLSVGENRDSQLTGPTSRGQLLVIPRWCSGKESACQCIRYKRRRLNPWVGKIPWNRKWQPAPVFLPGKSHGQRNLAGYSPWGHKRVGYDWVHTGTSSYWIYILLCQMEIQRRVKKMHWKIHWWNIVKSSSSIEVP